MQEWKVGDEVEQEWFDPHYEDTLHPVRILKINKTKQTATVKAHAFGGDEPYKNEDMNTFHHYRAAQPNYPYQVGDRVHFRYFQRKVHGKKVDGLVGEEEGVWVKGTLVRINEENGELLVRHVNWEDTSKSKETWVARRLVRLA